jgi:hypothetical protein
MSLNRCYFCINLVIDLREEMPLSPTSGKFVITSFVNNAFRVVSEAIAR